jgi:hypothetical protein
MDEKEALEALACAGMDSQIVYGQWSTSAKLLAALDAIGREGAVAIVKVDGGRADANVYTVAISGGHLAEEFFRKDGSELLPLLREAVGFYASKLGKP